MPGDSWITGRNWDQSLWPGAGFRPRRCLTRPHKAAGLARRVDGHAGWANSEAMRRAKVTQRLAGPVRRPDHSRFRQGNQPASLSTAR